MQHHRLEEVKMLEDVAVMTKCLKVKKVTRASPTACRQ